MYYQQFVLEKLDLALLFYGPDGKTRISVVNISGLASDAARQGLCQPASDGAFTWIKANPSPMGEKARRS